MPLLCRDGVYINKRTGGAEEVVPLRYAGGVGVVGRTTISAAASGVRNRLIGAILVNSGAAGVATATISDSTGVGGSQMVNGIQCPLNNTASPNVILPQMEIGYGDTTLNQGLYLDVLGQTIYYSIWYVQYTP